MQLSRYQETHIEAVSRFVENDCLIKESILSILFGKNKRAERCISAQRMVETKSNWISPNGMK